MHLSARRKSTHLPERFPIGTTYVVEGRGDKNGELRVFSRYVVFPGGRRVNLSNDYNGPAKSTPGRSSIETRRRSSGRAS